MFTFWRTVRGLSFTIKSSSSSRLADRLLRNLPFLPVTVPPLGVSFGRNNLGLSVSIGFTVSLGFFLWWEFLFNSVIGFLFWCPSETGFLFWCASITGFFCSGTCLLCRFPSGAGFLFWFPARTDFLFWFSSETGSFSWPPPGSAFLSSWLSGTTRTLVAACVSESTWNWTEDFRSADDLDILSLTLLSVETGFMLSSFLSSFWTLLLLGKQIKKWKGIESLPQTQIFENQYLSNLVVKTFDISNLDCFV